MGILANPPHPFTLRRVIYQFQPSIYLCIHSFRMGEYHWGHKLTVFTLQKGKWKNQKGDSPVPKVLVEI